MWKEQIRLEMARAVEAKRTGNAGRVRTCARRAVGIAITEWQRRDAGINYGRDFLRQLQGMSSDTRTPDEVRLAATRLQERLRKDFQSASREPMRDARIVIGHVLQRMGESPDVS